jgi:TonB family protein
MKEINNNKQFIKKLLAISFILLAINNMYAQSNTKDTMRDKPVYEPPAPSPNPPKIDSATIIYTVPQVFAKFPGNEMKYLADSIRYPEEAKEKKVGGIVYVSFVVEKDGSISNIKIIRSPDASLNNEAVRVISTMPKWIPGKEKGKTVRVYYTLPVRFSLPSVSSGSTMKK